MADKPPHNGKNGRLNGAKPYILGSVVSAILGSSGGIALFGVTPVGKSLFRPDPATGTELRRVSNKCESTDTTLTNHLLTHPDHAIKADLAELRAELRHLKEDINRLEKKLSLIHI